MKLNRDLIVLTIETLTDHVFEVVVHRQALVSDLKLKIRHMYGIEMQFQHLLSGSVELEDTQTLEHYHLKNGSTLKLVTALRGGPISYQTTPPPPAFLSLATFLLSSSEPDKPPLMSSKNDDKKEAKKTHSFYIVHNGCLLKIREYDGESAEDDARDYIRRLSKDKINEDELEAVLNKEKFDENAKLKDRMKDVRKNMDDKNSSVREKLERKKIPRPELPGVALINGYDKDKVPASTNEIKEMLRINRANKVLSQEKLKLKEMKGSEVFDDEDFESAETMDTEDSSKDEFGRRIKIRKKSITKKSRRNSKKSQESKPIPEKPANALQVKPIRLSERPKAIKRLSLKMDNTNSMLTHSTATATPKTSNQTNFKENKNKPKRSSDVLPELQKIFSGSGSHVAQQQIYATSGYGIISSSIERNINMDMKGSEFIREVKSHETRERKRDSITPELTSGKSDQIMKEESLHHIPGIEYDSFLTLMAMVRNTKRSFERTSSGHHSVGLTPRRFTHDGRTRESKDEVFKEPAITTKKINLASRPDSKHPEPPKPSGMVVVNRCSVCNKKLGIGVGYKCRCNKYFCATHKFPEEHVCTFDYKKEAREKIKKENPTVIGAKIKKLFHVQRPPSARLPLSIAY